MLTSDLFALANLLVLLLFNRKLKKQSVSIINKYWYRKPTQYMTIVVVSSIN